MGRIVTDVQTGEQVMDAGYALPDLSPPIAARRLSADIHIVDLLQKMVQAGAISGAEAKAWVRAGDIPQAVLDAIDALPTPKQQFKAEVEARRAAFIRRESDFIEALRVAFNRTPEQIDALFGIS